MSSTMSRLKLHAPERKIVLKQILFESWFVHWRIDRLILWWETSIKQWERCVILENTNLN